ncbi:MAG: hypothetical protein ACTSW1_17835 [Candidatus Hodarchaeales archaeon]
MHPKQNLTTWVDPKIKNHVIKVASLKGITMSEYLRLLVLNDLDERNIFKETRRLN